MGMQDAAQILQSRERRNLFTRLCQPQCVFVRRLQVPHFQTLERRIFLGWHLQRVGRDKPSRNRNRDEYQQSSASRHAENLATAEAIHNASPHLK